MGAALDDAYAVKLCQDSIHLVYKTGTFESGILAGGEEDEEKGVCSRAQPPSRFNDKGDEDCWEVDTGVV